MYDFPYSIFLFPFLIIAVIVMVSFGDSPASTTHYLDSLGYKQIQTHGYSFFGCVRDNDAIIRTSFSAINANGIKVHGTYCWEPVFGDYLQIEP